MCFLNPGHTEGSLRAATLWGSCFEIKSKPSSVRETLGTLQHDPCEPSALYPDSQPPWNSEHGSCHPQRFGVPLALALDQAGNDKATKVHRKSVSAPASDVP